MSKQVEEFVAENSDSTSRINSTLVELNSRRRRNLAFTQNAFRFTVTLEVEQRDLNDTLISGHPEEKHGSGRGIGGDYRGDWSVKSVDDVRAEFTIDGRKIVAEALNGEQGAQLFSAKIGNGTEGVSPSDTSMSSEVADTTGWTRPGSESNQTEFTAQFLFPAVITPTEFGAFSQSDDMYSHIGFAPFESPVEEELRFNATFEVNGQAPGDAVITDNGLEIVAESIRSRNTPIGLQDIVFGSGTGNPDPSDTSVDTPEFEVIGEREIETQQIDLRTVIPESLPQTQPHDINQVGVVTNNDILVWVAAVDTVEKDDKLSVTCLTTFSVR